MGEKLTCPLAESFLIFPRLYVQIMLSGPFRIKKVSRVLLLRPLQDDIVVRLSAFTIVIRESSRDVLLNCGISDICTLHNGRKDVDDAMLL